MKLPSHDDLGFVTRAEMKMHQVVTAAAAPVPEPDPPQPMAFVYTQTQVLPDMLARIQRHPGVVKQDRSALAESFRMLRNQVLMRMRADGHKLLAVTSARPIEGKSLTALNLAMTIAAEPDSSALLLDADLSGQGLQDLLGLLGDRGLSDHLVEGLALPGLLINPGLPRLVLLAAGQQPALGSAELLGARAMQGLAREMKQRYEDRFVIVDLPPLLDTADALAFLPCADTTLLVVEEHSTSLQDLEAASKLLAPFNLIGSVMSRKPPPDPQAGKSGKSRPWYRR